MKTAYIAPFSMDSLRGTPIRARNMFRALCEISEAHLIAHCARSVRAAQERLHETGACGLFSFTGKTLKILRATRPDVLHGCTSASVFPMFIYKLCFSWKVRIVYELHGWAWYEQRDSGRPLVRLIFHTFDHIGLWFSSGIIVVSKTYKEFLSRKITPERLAVIWDAAEFDVPFVPPPARKGIIVGYLGGAGWWQGLTFIIGAAEKLQKRDDIRFLVAGFEPKDKKLFPELPNVLYPGFVKREHVVETIRSCDVMLSTRVEETSGNLLFPLKLAEYMAAGRPVISSGAGDQVEIIRSANCGIVVTPISSTALADAIGEFAAKPYEGRVEMARRAHSYARQHLLYPSLKKKLETFYRRFGL